MLFKKRVNFNFFERLMDFVQKPIYNECLENSDFVTVWEAFESLKQREPLKGTILLGTRETLRYAIINNTSFYKQCTAAQKKYDKTSNTNKINKILLYIKTYLLNHTY